MGSPLSVNGQYVSPGTDATNSLSDGNGKVTKGSSSGSDRCCSNKSCNSSKVMSIIRCSFLNSVSSSGRDGNWKGVVSNGSPSSAVCVYNRSDSSRFIFFLDPNLALYRL